MQSQMSVLLHHPARGLLCPQIPRVPSHGQFSEPFHCIVSRFTSKPVPPPSHYPPSLPLFCGPHLLMTSWPPCQSL